VTTNKLFTVGVFREGLFIRPEAGNRTSLPDCKIRLAVGCDLTQQSIAGFSEVRHLQGDDCALNMLFFETSRRYFSISSQSDVRDIQLPRKT
jgi:hypothetical protein